MLWVRNSTGAEGDLFSVPWCWSLKLGGLKRLTVSQMVGLESSGGFSHHMSSICMEMTPSLCSAMTANRNTDNCPLWEPWASHGLWLPSERACPRGVSELKCLSLPTLTAFWWPCLDLGKSSQTPFPCGAAARSYCRACGWPTLENTIHLSRLRWGPLGRRWGGTWCALRPSSPTSLPHQPRTGSLHPVFTQLFPSSRALSPAPCLCSVSRCGQRWNHRKQKCSL